MNKNPEVEDYLEKKKHPLDKEIRKVRDIILSAHPDIEETIKWNSPTFLYKGNMASYFMNSKKHVSLMFHKGALINDETGLLEGEGKEGRTARFKDLNDIEVKKESLIKIVLQWVTMRDLDNKER